MSFAAILFLWITPEYLVVPLKPLVDYIGGLDVISSISLRYVHCVEPLINSVNFRCLIVNSFVKA